MKTLKPALAVLACALLFRAVPAQQPAPDFAPDPASVQRLGAGYRYPQAGWIVLHIEGEPYERGFQHGALLAPEIADYIASQAHQRSTRAPEDGWRDARLLTNALFLRGYDRELLAELKGIADGASAAGAQFDHRPLDLLDLATVNSLIEIECLDDALDATPTGLEGARFDPPMPMRRGPEREHCSAFAATGPATADGKIVFGHITMWSLAPANHMNVWLDVKPSKGHRVLMQTYPGGIQSGMDYYLNDAGLLVAETTLAQTRFELKGRPLACRIRRVLQDCDGIDGAVDVLTKENNGLYTNEWLLADTKTNEIAMFELGTARTRLWRSSKNEWLAGAEGFYWGCNNTKDLQVRLETAPGVEGMPAAMVFRPSDRDLQWLRLYDTHKGKIDAKFGFLAFSTAPLAASISLDAKFTTSALARELKTWALFGPPLRSIWEPTEGEKSRNPLVRALVPNDWTVLHAAAPESARNSSGIAVDLVPRPESEENEREKAEVLPPAWHGTLLPESDADIWLATAFASYERIFALAQSLQAPAQKTGTLESEPRKTATPGNGNTACALDECLQDRIALALFAPRSRYQIAVRRLGRDVPLADTRPDERRGEWFDIAAGKGVLLLAELRTLLGDEVFLAAMDAFGRANAGKAVSTASFRQHVEKVSGKPLAAFFDSWLRGAAAMLPAGGIWSVDSFEEEPEQSLIVYGTVAEARAQRQAAEALRREVAARWHGFEIPVKADRDVTDAELESHHVVLVGRPDSNAIAARFAPALPLRFGPGSFVLRGKTYAKAETAVIAAGDNPLNPRWSCVLFAGLSAEATWRCVQGGTRGKLREPAEVVLLAARAAPRSMCVQASRGAAAK